MLRKSFQILRINAAPLYRKSCSPITRSAILRAREIGYVVHGISQNILIRTFCSQPTSPFQPALDRVTYEHVCEVTLDSLTEYFDEIVEGASHLKSSDVSYSDGVLTVQFGKPYGTYVINRQTPNMQIWLSSPTSGPKRYDFVDNCWIYRHTGETLHALLDSEISAIVKTQVDFQQKCAHGKR